MKFLIFSFLFLASCAGLPPDEPLCVEISPAKGSCVKTMSGEEFDVDETHLLDGKTWWEHRPAMIQMPATTWVKLKSWIIKSCKNNRQCDKAVASWDRTVEKLDEKVKQNSEN